MLWMLCSLALPETIEASSPAHWNCSSVFKILRCRRTVRKVSFAARLSNRSWRWPTGIMSLSACRDARDVFYCCEQIRLLSSFFFHLGEKRKWAYCPLFNLSFNLVWLKHGRERTFWCNTRDPSHLAPPFQQPLSNCTFAYWKQAVEKACGCASDGLLTFYSVSIYNTAPQFPFSVSLPKRKDQRKVCLMLLHLSVMTEHLEVCVERTCCSAINRQATRGLMH